MSLSIITLAAYLVLGAVAGLIAGLLGLGGGIVIVPALLFIFIKLGFPAPVLMHLAVATSLATIFFTAIASALAHHRQGAVLWPVVKLLVPGIVVGAMLGAVVADYLPSESLRTFFGVFEILVACQIGFGFRPDSKRQL
ncbi:MAG TPA: sulfite exporter TauE/SafE family protein, partial [Gammaproteobacteria bacterium]|nr:sulfite exporter TauE/SafE family protein [Gammaproteobacteria bacterium]